MSACYYAPIQFSQGFLLSVTDEHETKKEDVSLAIDQAATSTAGPALSPPSQSMRKKSLPPNVTVIHPSANHPMFSYLCHATGNMSAAMPTSYLSPASYPAIFPSVDLPPAAAASLMNPFLFSHLLRHQLPPTSGMDTNTALSPANALQAYSRAQATSHRFSPYSMPISSAPLPPVSVPSLLSRSSVTSAGEDLKNLLSNLSRLKGEV